MPDRALPSTVPHGFARITGIPNTITSKPYFAEAAEAMARCAKDPRCVGVSAQRLFYGPVGTPDTMTGNKGENESIVRVG